MENRTCLACGAPMAFDTKKSLWVCAECGAAEEGEDVDYDEEEPRYTSFKEGGPHRSQKR